MGSDKAYDYDVIILGGSISATITALTLQARNLSVAVLDNGSHPRFALGESLLKPTVLWLQYLAEKFKLPELAVLANVEKISTEIAPTSGVKKCFGFVQHERGNHRIVDQWWSNVAVSYEEEVVEAHFFRQDIDAYLFRAAASRCELARSNANVEAIDTCPDGVTVSTNGDQLRAKYLFDCTGPTSKMARDHDLRDHPTRYRSASRSLFTHMIGVRRFDDCDCAPQPALGWHDGTLHHILEDGWIWVIPFDNTSTSTNPIVSVGVTFDSTKNPKSELSAEEEWAQLLDKYPALERQFGQAKIVRPWVSTGNLQYSASSAVGERFCLIGAAYGGIDALFSRGLLNTMQSISMAVDLVTNAIEKDTFQPLHFKPLDELQYKQLEINDRLTTGTYAAFGFPELTTWWLSVWTLIEQKSIEHAQNVLQAAASESDSTSSTATAPPATQCICDEDTILELLESGVAVMQKFSKGAASETETRSSLTNLSIKMAPLGFNFPIYSRLIKQLGFHPRSRLLLQTEHALVSMVDDLDNRLQLPNRLRSQPAIMCLIRQLSACSAKNLPDNSKGVDSRPIEIDQDTNTLLPELHETMRKWVTDTSRHESIGTQLRLLRRVKLIRTMATNATPAPPPGMTPLLKGQRSKGQCSVWQGTGRADGTESLYLSATIGDNHLGIMLEYDPLLADYLGLTAPSNSVDLDLAV